MDKQLIERLIAEASGPDTFRGVPLAGHHEAWATRFAALVAEECAKIAENVQVPFGHDNGEEIAAAAIRVTFAAERA